MKSIPVYLTAIVILASPAPVLGAGKAKSVGNPDFTKGEAIPTDAKHDWNLGAVGARGWMYFDKMVTSDARQIVITKVDKGAPAEGVLEAGDVILGADGKPFSQDPRTELGRALTLAESDAGRGRLTLTRWRAGSTSDVVVKIPVLGTYSATAPYNCPKSTRILEIGCKDLAKRMAEPSYAKGLNPIPRSLNALALLASGDPAYLPLIRKETEWARDFATESMATWYYGYIMMFLSEYRIATGDDSVVPGLKRLALEAAHGQSAVGSWGHKFAQPDGRLFGYGMMNSPGVPLTSAMAMARIAGVKDPALDQAIERSAKLLRFYIGKGCIPYGDHAPWMQTHEDNGKCGMVAVMFNLLGEAKGAEFFSRMSVASHGNERDCGHTGNFFNVFGKMLKKSLAGADQAQLRKAVVAGLQNQDGRARGEIGGVYQQLSYEQLKPLLPAIRQAIVEPAPSGEMFAAGIRLAGIDILAKHRIKEGMELCFAVMEIDKWGKGRRVPECLKTLATYGAAAKPMLPRLRQLEKDLPANGMQAQVAQVSALIREIETSIGTVELKTLNQDAGVN